MELERIKATDIRTGLRVIREQFGPDAMIISNKRVADGVEIVVTSDRPLPDMVQPTMSAPARSSTAAQPELEDVLAARKRKPVEETIPSPETVFPTADKLSSLVAKSLPQAPVAAADDVIQALQSELRSMRALLEQQLGTGSASRALTMTSAQDDVWQRLGRQGFPEELIQRMIAVIHPREHYDAAWQKVQDQLAGEFSVTEDPVMKGGIHAVVGPTGAGKSTTLCKLAVRWALANGTESMALVSLDSQRVGGADMPRAIARLLEIPFVVAEAGESLDAVLQRVRGKRLVLIDTAGLVRNHGEQQRLYLEQLAAAHQRINTLLVLPATGQATFLKQVVDQYREALPSAAVISKIDEAVQLGDVLGELNRERLPLSYLTDGPDIPDDIRVADIDWLIECALRASDADHCTGQFAESAQPQATAPMLQVSAQLAPNNGRMR